MARRVVWWKICEHPVIQGLSRIFMALGVPIFVGGIFWLANSFDHMRQDVTRLNILVGTKLAEIERRQDRSDKVRDDLALRLWQVEHRLIEYGAPTPGRR